MSREGGGDTKESGRVLFFQLGLTGGQDYWPDSGTIPNPPKQVTGVGASTRFTYLLSVHGQPPPNETMKKTN
jgi:hypothetical protein